jgi:hypothetical protein
MSSGLRNTPRNSKQRIPCCPIIPISTPWGKWGIGGLELVFHRPNWATKSNDPEKSNEYIELALLALPSLSLEA